MKKAFNQMTYSSYDERDTAVSLTAVDLGMYGGGSRTLITDDKAYTLNKASLQCDGIEEKCGCLTETSYKDPPADGRGMSVRRLTPLECCRLQGFPDDWCDGVEGSDSDQYRRCPRGCKFCIVGEKEGLKSHQVADLDEFYRGQKFLNLLDPNILGCRNADALLEQLVKTGAYVEFNQGLDARFLTKERIQILSHLNVRMIHFAWDNPNDEVTPVKLQQFADAKITDNKRKVHVYVLTNFGSTHEEDLDRVYRLRAMGYTPYIMIYDKPHAPRITRRLARWVNNKWFFNACEKFEEFTG